MHRVVRPRMWPLLAIGAITSALAQPAATLSGTAPLDLKGDLSREMVAGIDRFASRELERSIDGRSVHWNRNYASPKAYEQSLQINRDDLRRIIGAVDERVPMTGMEFVATTTAPAQLLETDAFTVYAVRWPVFENVFGEGLLVQPKGNVRARVVVLPDADQTPEMLVGLVPYSTISPYARRMAENGAQVVIPVLVDRRDEWSGNARINRFTNQPHREWIYRQAYEMGRHIIGYEVQKVLAAVDWFTQENKRGPSVPIGVAGFAEGGLLAFYAAAIDVRIAATLVSGYFDSRQKIWAEPIYRNVFGLLLEFGDAEIAAMIAPRALVVEHCLAPSIDGPPAVRRGRNAAGAPGVISTPLLNSVEKEFARAKWIARSFARGFHFAAKPEDAIAAFWSELTADESALSALKAPFAPPKRDLQIDARQQRQIRELEEHTQKLVRQSEEVRQQFFWQKMKTDSPESWAVAATPFKTILWNDIFGRLPTADRVINAQTRMFEDRPKWTGYEVVLNVWKDVFAWGYLLLPKNMRFGERRPVIVCQHGLEGLPADTINEDSASRAYGYYKSFAARLAERGFIVFAPHNPYRGRDDFRGLQRKLNPLKKTLYSVMIAQHGRILDWLGTQPYVDSSRIAFYGLSYGGKTAMRIPAIFDRYAVSICSGDFNEWIRKNSLTDARFSYMFSPEYEMFEFNLGNTFNYAEMAALIAPRPFMVERGHLDAVGTDEWVSYEFAKVRRLYTELGISERTAIEYFDGPHTINGVGTFDFLHQQLNWPKK